MTCPRFKDWLNRHYGFTKPGRLHVPAGRTKRVALALKSALTAQGSVCEIIDLSKIFAEKPETKIF